MSISAQFFIPAPSGSGSGTQRSTLRRRRYIDPQTGDYVVEAGQLKHDPGFTSDVVLALRTPLGSCQAFPTFGSRLHEVKRADEQGRRLAERFAVLALAHMKRKVDDLTVVAALPKNRPGAIELAISGHRGATALSAVYTHVLR